MKKIILFSLFIIAFYGGIAYAEIFFERADYPAGQSPVGAASGDFNRDGKIDLAISNELSDNVSILIAIGDGTFQGAVNYSAGDAPVDIIAADLNSDGALDLVTVNLNSNDISVLLNNGNGTFGSPASYGVGASPRAAATADFDRNGTIDLAVANSGSASFSVLLGNGDGTFANQSAYPTGYSGTSCVAAADFNGDGKMDIAALNRNANNIRIFSGNGLGSFTAGVAVSTGSSPCNICAADLNMDGKTDLAAANSGSSNVSVLLGNGNGTFLAAASYAAGMAPWDISCGDYNTDSSPDLLVSNTASQNISFLRGNGNGTFASPVNLSAGATPRSITEADFNGDGDMDFAVPNDGVNSVSVCLGNGGDLNDAVYYFEPPLRTMSLLEGYGSLGFSSVVTDDFNRDGWADAVIFFQGPGYYIVLTNDKSGAFTISPPFDANPICNTTCIKTGDFNRDGKLDMVVNGISYGIVEILLGNGNGTFGVSGYYFTGDHPNWVEVADLDLDGISDIVTANPSNEYFPAANFISVLKGNPDGTFQPYVSYSVSDRPQALVIRDFNKDGKPDIATANSGSNNIALLLGNGDGTFQTPVYYAGGNEPFSITAGDFNRDGNEDAAVANSAVDTNIVSIFMGNGDGTFEPPSNYPCGVEPIHIITKDINRDGALDLVTANNNNGRYGVTALFGNGNGTFKAPLDLERQVYGAAYYVAAEDFNRDGKEDIITMGPDGIIELFLYRGIEPRAMLWNKLGSDGEVSESNIGLAGAWSGASSYLSCKFNNGANASDAGNFIEFQPYIPFFNTFTVEWWFKTDWNCVNGHSDDGSSHSWFAWYLDNLTKISLETRSDPGAGTYFSSAVNGSGWSGKFPNSDSINWSSGTLHHFALSYDRWGIENGPDKARVYLDGKLIGGITDDLPYSQWYEYILRIMAFYDTGDRPLKGTMDNLKVWDYPKTDFKDRFTEESRHPPIFTQAIDRKDGYEGSALTFNIQAFDWKTPASELVFSSPNLPAGAVITNNHDGQATFSWTPPYTASRPMSYNIRFEVSDGEGSDHIYVPIDVRDVRVAGTIYKTTPTGNEPLEDATVSLLSMDRERLFVTTYTDSAGKFRITTSSPIYLPEDYYIVKVEKGGYGSYSGLMYLRNYMCFPFAWALAPSQFTGLPAGVTINENEPYTLNITATDPNGGDTLRFSSSNLPDGATLADNGNRTATFNWTPTRPQAGMTHSINLTVTDGLFNTDAVLSIEVKKVNIPPVLSAIPDCSAQEGVTLKFKLQASDPDMDTLIFSSPNLPIGSGLDSATGEFSWKPAFGQQGFYAVTFKVSDGQGGEDVKTANITVINSSLYGNVYAKRTNQPIPNARITVYNKRAVAATALTDPSGSYVIANNLPSGMYIVKVGANGYQPSTDVINILKDQTIKRDFILKKYNN